MRKTKRLHLDALQVDSFSTLDRALEIRGTVHANADLVSADGTCVDPGPGESWEYCVVETWEACPSEYRTACEPATDPRICAVEYPTDPLPA